MATAVARPTPAPPPRVEPPLATNAWARRTIRVRATQFGLSPEQANRTASVAVWYYGRILLAINRSGRGDQELPASTNRYLVPVTLALACRYDGRPVELERLLRLSGTPTRRTVENAYALLDQYSRLFAAASTAPVVPASSLGMRRPTPAAVRRRPTPANRDGAARLPGPARVPAAATTLALPRAPFASAQAPGARSGRGAPGPRGPQRPRQLNSNNWVRTRVPELCRALGVPDPVRDRALLFYEQIVDLHTSRSAVPAGKRVELSPRLNWSLGFTTIYLACRFEEYPLDLPMILGRNPPEGTVREMYRLYRFYKRELGLAIKLVDVRTFIHSWLDGVEVKELVREEILSGEPGPLRSRAIAIANRIRTEPSLRSSSTRIVAAGALTTALAERRAPPDTNSFYRFMARLLHISEEAMRVVMNRIAVLI